MKNPRSIQGEETRERLLDALESMVATKGIAALSHRTLAQQADVHPGLVHYHFGTLDRAVEEALARRSTALVHAQLASITKVVHQPGYDVADLVHAWWKPFEQLARSAESGWHHYFCLIARLTSARDGDDVFHRVFAPVILALRQAVSRLVPGVSEDVVRGALRHVWTLFEREIRSVHCGLDAVPVGGRTGSQQMIRFAAAGFERAIDRPDVRVSIAAD